MGVSMQIPNSWMGLGKLATLNGWWLGVPLFQETSISVCFCWGRIITHAWPPQIPGGWWGSTQIMRSVMPPNNYGTPTILNHWGWQGFLRTAQMQFSGVTVRPCLNISFGESRAKLLQRDSNWCRQTRSASRGYHCGFAWSLRSLDCESGWVY